MSKGLKLTAIVEETRQRKENLGFLKVRTSDAFYDLTVFGDVSEFEEGSLYEYGLEQPSLYNSRISYVVKDFKALEGGEK